MAAAFSEKTRSQAMMGSSLSWNLRALVAFISWATSWFGEQDGGVSPKTVAVLQSAAVDLD